MFRQRWSRFWKFGPAARHPGRYTPRRPTACPPSLELLEDRTLLSGQSFGLLSADPFFPVSPPALALQSESEPNDTQVLANPIATDGLTQGTLDEGDVDVFRLEIPEPGRLTARVAATGFDSRLELLGSADGGALVVSDATSAVNPDDLLVQHLEPGTYFLRVSSLPGASSTGSYMLTTDFTLAAPPFTPIAVGTNPVVVVTGDFNGDHIPDLATANQGSQDISILLGLGDGTFQRLPTDIPVGGQPVDLKAADFNGDGLTDLVIVTTTDNGFGSSTTVSVLLAAGDGTFQQAVSYPFLDSAAVAVGDFNHDGPIDLAVGAPGGQVLVTPHGISIALGGLFLYPGQGDGTFAPPIMTFVPDAPHGPLVAGDFNQDGNLDLAADDGSVLLGSGNGSFTLGTSLPAGLTDTFGQLVTGDFNGDGLPDLASIPGGFGFTDSSDITGFVRVGYGRGDGTFVPAPEVIVQDLPTHLVAADLNGDGRTDLATSGAVLLGHADGTFEPEKRFDFLGALAAADFNGDGRLDLAAANTGASTVAVFLGNGDGSVQARPRNRVGAGPGSLTAPDLNDDGRADLVNINAANRSISVLLSQRDGAYANEVRYPTTGTHPKLVVSGDFNEDGRADLALLVNGGDVPSIPMPFYQLVIYLGLGDGSLQFANKFEVPVRTDDDVGVLAGDFNGDGLTDLVVNQFVFLASRDGTFQQTDTPLPDSAVAVGDFNGDGRDDLVLASSGGDRVALSQGDGVFQVVQSLSVATPPLSGSAFRGNDLVTGDFNGDDHLDLAIRDPGTDDVALFLGNGKGTFQEVAPRTQVAGLVGASRVLLAAGDFDNDGFTDLVVVAAGGFGSPATVSLLWGGADGTFTAHEPFLTQSSPTSVAAADLDGDGRLDLALSNPSGDDSALLGQGDGTFQDAALVPAAPPLATPQLADLNGDGTLDSIVASGSGEVLVRFGRPGERGQFSAPVVANPDPAEAARDVAIVSSSQGMRLAVVEQRTDVVAFYDLGSGGTFRRTATLDTAALPVRIVSGDLNGDGRGDLVVTNAGAGSLSVFLADAAGGFTRQDYDLRGIGALAVTLVDGSLGPDLVVTNQFAVTVNLLLNDGQGAFSAALPFDAGTGPHDVFGSDPNAPVRSPAGAAGVAVGDFNEDGVPDLVVTQSNAHRFTLLLGKGAGGFADPQDFLTGSDAAAAAAGDFNGDGHLDVAVLSEGMATLSVFLGDGRGGFTEKLDLDPLGHRTVLSAGNGPTGLAVHDLNGDGILDLQVGNATGDVLTLLGDGDGTFQPYQRVNRKVALAVADLNGDGQNDFIFGNQGSDRVAVQYSGPGPEFAQDRSAGLLAPDDVVVADLNGDGVPDLIVANSGANNVKVFPGITGGQFGVAQTFFTGTDPVGVSVADVNGDGLLDVLVANEGSNDVSVLLGNPQAQAGAAAQSDGTPMLVPGPRLGVGQGPVQAIAQDVNGDGVPELVVTNSQSDNVYVLSGQNGFFDDRHPVVFQTGSDPQQTFVGNFDGNPGLDLVTLNAGSNNLTFFGNPTFGSSLDVGLAIDTGGRTPLTAVAADFTGDGRLDLIVGNNGSGTVSVLTSGPDGLTLQPGLTQSGVLHPSSLALSTVGNNSVQVYATQEGEEQVTTLSFTLDASGLPVPGLPGPTANDQGPSTALLALQESTFAVVATLLTGVGEVTEAEAETATALALGDTEAAGVNGAASGGGGETDVNREAAVTATPEEVAETNFRIGLEEALEAQPPLERDAVFGASREPASAGESMTALQKKLRGWVASFLTEVGDDWVVLEDASRTAAREIKTVSKEVQGALTGCDWRLPDVPWREVGQILGEAAAAAASACIREFSQGGAVVPGEPLQPDPAGYEASGQALWPTRWIEGGLGDVSSSLAEAALLALAIAQPFKTAEEPNAVGANQVEGIIRPFHPRRRHVSA